MAPGCPPACPSPRAGIKRGGLYLVLFLLVVCSYFVLSMVALFWLSGSVDGNNPSTWPSGGGTTALVSLLPPPAMSTTAGSSPEPSPDFGDSVVILVSLEDGAAGGAALVEWASSADDRRSKLPSVWIKCHPNSTLEAAVRSYETPNIFPFVVNRTSSWTETFDLFLSRNANASLIGLFAEGSVPHVGLPGSIHSLVPALSRPTSPTAVLVRSRSRGDGSAYEDRWLPDAFVAQVWCNRAVLEPRRLEDVLTVQTEAGRDQLSVGNHTLLQILPSLLAKSEPLGSGSASRSGLGLVLVDGTNVLRSTFAGVDLSSGGGRSYALWSRINAEEQLGMHPPPNPQEEQLLRGGPSWKPSKTSSNSSRGMKHSGSKKNEIHIGNSKFALVFDAPGSEVKNGSTAPPSAIVKAPWPPMYVLETAASILRAQVPAGSPRGLVLVTSVNCGYLDMAANLLLSVRNTTDAKILFVAMDEVAFDFLDDLAPGCTAMVPPEVLERKHVAGAGTFGGKRFADEVLVRPSILTRILEKQFAVLWTDSDMVWLKDPFPLLPDIGDMSTAEVALQHDGSELNKCTCFLFLKPTPLVRALVESWREGIIKYKQTTNQPPFQHPLSELEALGMHVDVIPQEVFPPGKDLFLNDHLPDYTIPEQTVIVHNNWVKGHTDKKARFVKHHLWYVDAVPFPDCVRDYERSPGDKKQSPRDKKKSPRDKKQSPRDKKHKRSPRTKTKGSNFWSRGWFLVFVLSCGILAGMAFLVFSDSSRRVRERRPHST